MNQTASNAADESAIMHPGQSQAALPSLPGKITLPGRAGPESVSRSEPAMSVDLSAASNVAAQGEESQHGGGSASGMVHLDFRNRSSDAEKWFQDSNKNASTRGNVSFIDHDPPFHIPQRHNGTPATRHLPVRTATGTPAFQPPSLQPYQSIQSSSSGEFRSVIDDLTVENKKLRKKVKMLERLQVAHLHPDRMFEVRMPGLAGKDKQRLERLLKDFADSVSGSDMGGQYARPSKKRSKKTGSSNKPSSSSTPESNISNHNDSAYASATSAGNVSGSQQDSRTMTSDSTSRHGRKLYKERGEKDQNVRSYLQNISQGLLPQRPTAMTENARKKEVVKRLEQLFTGKASTNSKNSQSAQQQEVSTAAAKDDKKANEARGRPYQAEGNREANILHAEAEADMLRNESSNSKNRENPSPLEGTNQTAADQRPTRPLDLDLNRAQHAADNIAYIRHLGFQPRTNINDDKNVDDGWMYLNLLMGMAQLHTANVTPDFVRQALAEISDKFEVSADGTRIRWKGGSDGTRMSGDSDMSEGSKNSSPPDQEMGGLKTQSPHTSRGSKPSGSDQPTAALKGSGVDSSRTKLSSRDLSSSTDATPSTSYPRRKRPVFLGHITREHSFQYEPLFLHGGESDDEGDYFLNEDDSLLSSALREDVTGSGGSSQRAKRHPKATPGKDDGPMIFYHRAKFVTDLSGDKGFTAINNTAYTRATQHAIGSEPAPDMSLVNETRGPISTNSPAVLSAMGCQSEDDTDLPDFVYSLPSRQSKLGRRDALPLPVSGLFGVTPAENMVFYPQHLQSSRKREQPLSALNNTYRKAANHIRQRLFNGDKDLLERIAAQDSTDVRLEGAGPVKHAELEPSELPPPNYAHMSSSSLDEASYDSDDESSEEDFTGENSGADGMPDFAPPALMLTHEETGMGSGSEESTDDEDMDDDDDDGEVDLLAHERALNAEEVAMREREWEENFREPSPDAKSSQATVGDRSFLSDEEEDESPDRDRNPRRRNTHAGSKRGREQVEGDGAVPASPAKRVETSRTKSGRK